MEPKFKIGDTVKYSAFGSNQNFRGRVIGIDVVRSSAYRVGFGTEFVETGFAYTVLCTCCESTKHLNEHALEKVEEDAACGT